MDQNLNSITLNGFDDNPTYEQVLVATRFTSTPKLYVGMNPVDSSIVRSVIGTQNEFGTEVLVMSELYIPTLGDN